ncbi:MAG TPA: HAD family hydrolase [Anaerolineaceae bacterium]|jgi:HAD superfamily hydrolase (TIGR01549 family)|nr:HAD family hydrolase [Anaerolineaceae bacterium]
MALNSNHIQALCFDVDGTLSDTDDLWAAKLEERLRFLRRFFPRRGLRPLARALIMGAESPANVLYHLFDRLGLDDEVARLTSAISRHSPDRQKHNFWLIPGVAGLLDQLSGHYPLAVVSARGEQSTLAFLEQFGLRRHFQTVVTAQTCAFTKPFPHPIRHAAAALGVAPEHCLMIGDTTVDIRAGRAAGAQTVGVLCGFGSERELHRAGADLILNSTAELATHLTVTREG